MGRKNDLSNLLSKKVDHNQRKRHNQYHRYNANRGASGYTSPEASSDPTNNTEAQTHNSSSRFGGNYSNNSTPNGINSAKLTIKMPLAMKISLTIIIAIVPIIFLMLFVVLFGNEGISNGAGLSFGGYYSSNCDEITVIFTDKSQDYAVTGTGTYPVEEYVAGVVYGELFRLATNEELAKTYALAARTFGFKHVDETCTIESSDRRQVFRDITDIDNNISRAARVAAEATTGQVLIQNNELYPVQYDAFCTIGKENNYYIIKQNNQQIPVEWAEKQGMPSSWLNGTCAGNHGRGMSTYGAYYLATEKGYTYDELIEYYYGDLVTISSDSIDQSVTGITSVAGLEIKDTTKASPLKEPITTYLSSKGSSIDDLNNFVHASVEENGAGTREGVVTAAVSMINYLYDNFKVKLPYYWGGKVSSNKIPSSFGTYSPSAVSRGGNINYYKSFDCSGFVSWAIRSGGYNFSNNSTVGFDSNYSQNSCNIKDSSCIGQPGDLINSRAGHVELIIAVDLENQKYFVAHSSGPGVVMQERNMHSGNSSTNTTKILHMDEFYNNPQNVNPNY